MLGIIYLMLVFCRYSSSGWFKPVSFLPEVILRLFAFSLVFLRNFSLNYSCITQCSTGVFIRLKTTTIIIIITVIIWPNGKALG